MDVSYSKFPSLNLDNVRSASGASLQLIDLDVDYLGIDSNPTLYE